MSVRPRHAAILLVGLLLLVGPLLYRLATRQGAGGTYMPPDVPTAVTAATPQPTVTPFAVEPPASRGEAELRPGPVVVDLAHMNRLNRTSFQALAAALAERNIGLRFWLPVDVDLFNLNSFLDFPDQSKQLSEQLADASALLVASPYFLWSPQEIALIERFVADGGRLVLISDPDVSGDVARDINNVGEPFGVVYVDDYLYDTATNDQNFTHIFLSADDSELGDAQIALYGARSIEGSGAPLAHTVDTVRSSLRTGRTSFVTAVLAGKESNSTVNHVLALSDFDVLTEPFVDRFDNRRMLEMVADFLVGGQRGAAVADFPAYLGRHVGLVFGSADAVDAALLTQGAQLQAKLEESGRTLTLSSSALLTGSVTSEAGAGGDGTAAGALDASSGTIPPPADLIYLADYETAEQQAGLLTALGIRLVEATATPTRGSDAAAPELPPGPSVPGMPGEAGEETDEVAPPLSTAPAPGAPAAPLPGTATAPAPLPTLPTDLPPELPPAPQATATPPEKPEIAPEPGATSPGPAATALPTTVSQVNRATPTTGALGATVEVSPTAEASATQSAGTEQGGAETPVEEVGMTPVATFTATVTPTVTPSPTSTATPTPQTVVFLEVDTGLRLLAEETLLIAQQEWGESGRLVAVLGAGDEALSTGVTRLLGRDLTGCISQQDVAICPVAVSRPTPAPTQATAGPAAGEASAPSEAPAPPGTAPRVLIIDDSDQAAADEEAEADLYLDLLTKAGYAPDTWDTASSGNPITQTLNTYDWVIWSGAGYAESGPATTDLELLYSYLNSGGQLTVSSRRPWFGQSSEPATPILDVVADSGEPLLVRDFPNSAISLPGGLPAVSPLDPALLAGASSIVALRRGPASQAADAPLLFVVTDAEEEQPTGARLMVLGMSIAWLPDDYGRLLVRNMADYMLAQ